MSWPFKDYDMVGDRYVTVKDTSKEFGELTHFERDIDKKNTPTECIICIEAETEMYTKYAHPKAHLEAHIQATNVAETLAIKEKYTEEYIEYYIFYYGREYKKIYKDLYKKYKKEYSDIVFQRKYGETVKICEYHHESIRYYYECKQLPD